MWRGGGGGCWGRKDPTCSPVWWPLAALSTRVRLPWKYVVRSLIVLPSAWSKPRLTYISWNNFMEFHKKATLSEFQDIYPVHFIYFWTKPKIMNLYHYWQINRMIRESFDDNHRHPHIFASDAGGSYLANWCLSRIVCPLKVQAFFFP